MSCGVMAYLVNTDRLKSFIGSEKDNSAIFNLLGSFKKSPKKLILNEYSYELREVDDLAREGSLSESLSISEKILDEFLSGNISGNYGGHLYGYTFEIICKYLGEYLNNSCWYPCDPSSFSYMPFAAGRLPIGFPIPDEYPGISFISHEVIDLSNIKFEFDFIGQEKQFESWLVRAVNTKEDIYIFYY